MNRVETICIIDDDPIYIFGMKKMITVNNICSNILIFHNGHEAIEYLTSNNPQIPDVIFLDINMPIMDGWDFLNEFCKIKNKFSKEIYVNMVTSSIDPNDIERSKGYKDIKNYLVKPVKQEDIRTIFSTI